MRFFKIYKSVRAHLLVLYTTLTKVLENDMRSYLALSLGSFEFDSVSGGSRPTCLYSRITRAANLGDNRSSGHFPRTYLTAWSSPFHLSLDDKAIEGQISRRGVYEFQIVLGLMRSWVGIVFFSVFFFFLDTFSSQAAYADVVSGTTSYRQKWMLVEILLR